MSHNHGVSQWSASGRHDRLALDGIPKNYIQCQFYHSCQYRGTTYSIHMELDVPSYFPTEQLALFIRPDVGKPLPLENQG